MLKTKKGRPEGPEQEEELWVDTDRERLISWVKVVENHLLQASRLGGAGGGTGGTERGLGEVRRESLDAGILLPISLLACSSYEGPEQYWHLGCHWVAIGVGKLRVIEAKFRALPAGCQVEQ